ncbi:MULTISPECIES: response regulator [Crocosphaera]|uniref:Two-component response regulator n=5 Tax=Crocosphaera watsonii TaxID=263511 RepID=T2IY43_CROWT|nr:MULTISPECIES: response regulator transcription factor [Crocosphaera]MCH2247950.1 response regulator transcription factor [Crocosphaera sp.]NQZ64569.1 response regulator transcription factor [Crocosphaera sp.]CCQ57824.1 two-component response regulator [Crocosphaera watsonii WH 0005]CCQ60614.1 two-component response regulator [Crocosphaera watsonii WH 0401]
MRILIVEDDPLMQLGLEQALGEHPNFEIVGQAEDGYIGVQKALELKPDLVVMDIGLPRLDGIAATKQIKEQLPDIHVVMLTSHTLQTEVVAALSSGADAYCIKGASLERLLAAIEAAQDGATYLDPQIARLVLDNLKPPTPEPNQNISLLSERELEVLKLIVEGKSNNQIAEDLYLSTNTIKTHVRGIMNKLAVDDRVQAAVVALRSGLV